MKTNIFFLHFTRAISLLLVTHVVNTVRYLSWIILGKPYGLYGGIRLIFTIPSLFVISTHFGTLAADRNRTAKFPKSGLEVFMMVYSSAACVAFPHLVRLSIRSLYSTFSYCSFPFCLCFSSLTTASPITLAKKPQELIRSLPTWKKCKKEKKRPDERHSYGSIHVFVLFPHSRLPIKRWRLRLIFIRYLDPWLLVV